jgi:hypothetical protein
VPNAVGDSQYPLNACLFGVLSPVGLAVVAVLFDEPNKRIRSDLSKIQKDVNGVYNVLSHLFRGLAPMTCHGMAKRVRNDDSIEVMPHSPKGAILALCDTRPPNNRGGQKSRLPRRQQLSAAGRSACVAWVLTAFRPRAGYAN